MTVLEAILKSSAPKPLIEVPGCFSLTIYWMRIGEVGVDMDAPPIPVTKFELFIV